MVSTTILSFPRISVFVQNFHEGFQTGCDLRTYEDHSPGNEDPDEEQRNQMGQYGGVETILSLVESNIDEKPFLVEV